MRTASQVQKKIQSLKRRSLVPSGLAIISLSVMSGFSTSGIAFGAGPQTGTPLGNSGKGAQLKGGHLGGVVRGGQIPVTGAIIQLYAVGSSGYGSASTPLFPQGTVVTDANGNWSVNSYTCPAGDPQVYITSTGGNSGYGGTNGNLLLMAALGDCTGTFNLSKIDVTETTTVATVWAFAPFMTGPANVGSSSSNVAGFVNAAADVNVLVNIGSGAVPGPNQPANAMVPVQQIDTLANALAYCTNSTGGVAGDGSPCGQLFSLATPPLGAAPTEMATAALNIAKYPAMNVAGIYGLAQAAPPSPPFQPALTAAPNDYTLALAFTGGGLSAPSALAIDVSSNVWVANNGVKSLTELSHTGNVVLGTTAGISNPTSIAIDQNNVIWVTNQNGNSVSRLSAATGSLLGGSPITGGGLNKPIAVALDSLGNAWIMNNGGNSVTVINNAGTSLQAYTPAGVSAPTAIGANPH